MKVFASFFKKKTLFFFEKKNQKTFIRYASAIPLSRSPPSTM